MASCIHFCDLKGKPILSRKFKNDPLIPDDALEKFPLILVEKILEENDENDQVTPIIEYNGVQYCFIKHNDLLILTLSSTLSMNIMSIFQFLYSVVDVLTTYCKHVESESIKENYVIIYELLDEMFDFGIPQITDTKMLKQYITQKSTKLIKPMKKSKNVVRPPDQLTDSVNWRNEGIKYKKNEAFLDVIESINMTINNKGVVTRSEILGEIKMKSRLSGMPDLRIGLNDKGLLTKKPSSDVSNMPNLSDLNGDDFATGFNDFSNGNGDDDAAYEQDIRGMQLEDLKFHQCVRLTKFENDKIITFVPPDGEFTLMNYRLNCSNRNLKPLIICEVKYDYFENSRLTVFVKMRSNYKKKSIANNVLINIPILGDYDTPIYKFSHGKLKLLNDSKILTWKLKNLPGGKEYSLMAEFKISSIHGNEFEKLQKKPIKVEFQIPYYTTSGIQVKYLKINEPKLGYKSYPWVRYITQSGDDYIIRQ
ncbi:hypothetical protein ACO0RG_001511 [Hanseniaspora osmophila]|uniref:AP-1 complex subunit mu-1-I n=1 Tax=Hanseniaspora osmophila TaxID=56408 RepID=A0A1E5R0R4_9ASCO|nr:AP-1 complex subunit mu-1-I [Hanseniaspora osmophila]